MELQGRFAALHELTPEHGKRFVELDDRPREFRAVVVAGHMTTPRTHHRSLSRSLSIAVSYRESAAITSVFSALR